MLRFDGRVALVTGAGGGLGRSYALYLASRGAAVVVNDLGGSRSGDGQSSKAADVVVKEIQDKGGKAAANYDSVENGHLLVKTAIEKFGRIDIIVNNAGILRDRSIVKLSEDDWDLVHRVHLKGAFKIIQAAWPYMKQQNYGRIVNTSSVAGLYGNFGQANYSAAKMGLVGLSKTCAVEGGKNNILCNVIVPMAASRLTEDVFLPEMMEKLKPEFIAPTVAWLCHENCPENGSIIESVGGWIGKYQLQRSQGCYLLPRGKTDFSIDDVASNWSKVNDFTNATIPERNEDAVAEIMDGLSKQEEVHVGIPASKEMSLENAVGFTSPPFEYTYTSKEIILYALSIGVSLRDEDGLEFLYEGHDNFAVQPGFGTIPGFGGLSQLLTGAIPGLSIDLLKVLHGEQYVEIINPIPLTGILVSHFKISAVLDKGSGALILLDIYSKDKATGLDIIHNQTSVFVAGAGGFGGSRTSNLAISPLSGMPSRSPDTVKEYKTDVDQAAFYRQNADLNPLHIDPGFASVAGFQQPILHGLCSLGIAIRQVGAAYAKNHPRNIKSFKARFAKPVLPGQTIITKMWLEKDTVQFESLVKETQTVCISGGWVKLHEAGLGDGVGGSGTQSGDNFSSNTSFKLAGQTKEIIRSKVLRDNKPAIKWELNYQCGPQTTFYEEDLGELIRDSKTHLEINDQDMGALLRGGLNPHSANLLGKMQVEGDFELVRQLTEVFGSVSKM